LRIYEAQRQANTAALLASPVGAQGTAHAAAAAMGGGLGGGMGGMGGMMSSSAAAAAMGANAASLPPLHGPFKPMVPAYRDPGVAVL
jgi:hypothetical protein